MAETKIKPEQGLSASTARFKIISATRDMTAATGNVAYTGVGFKPAGIILISAINSTLQYSIGMVDASTTTAELGNGQNTTNVSVDTSMLAVWAVGGGAQTGTLVSLDSDGFTMTWTKYLSPTGTLTFKAFCFR